MYKKLLYNKFKSTSDTSSRFLGYYTESNRKNKVYETVRHLINRNIMSSLTDQALIGKINLLKSSHSTPVEMSQQSQAALTIRFLLVDKCLEAGTGIYLVKQRIGKY